MASLCPIALMDLSCIRRFLSRGRTSGVSPDTAHQLLSIQALLGRTRHPPRRIADGRAARQPGIAIGATHLAPDYLLSPLTGSPRQSLIERSMKIERMLATPGRRARVWRWMRS